MSEISDQLLKLIDAARAMAEHERRATVAYFLSLAADAAIDEKSPPAPAEARPFKRRQWRWSGRGRRSHLL